MVTPGQSFGQEGKRFVRLALVEDVERIQLAAQRFKETDIFL